jgi:DNA-binding NarL/FixJ family response regulator
MAELLPRLITDVPDVLLVDIFVPDLNGGEAIKLLRSEYPSIKILVLSMTTDMELVSELLDAGIHGYISKTDDPKELLQAVTAVSEGRVYRNRLFTEALYWNNQNTIRRYKGEAQVSLEEREKRILQLIWNEKSNKEIAEELYLSIRSVEKIRQELKEKINVKSTVGLLKYAIKQRIIGIDLRPLGFMSPSGRQ